MRAVKQKISIILIFVFIANLLLPVMGFAAETNNPVIPNELTNNSSEQILLSPDTTSWGNQAGTAQSNGSSNSQSDDKEKEITELILENEQNVIKENSGNVETQFWQKLLASAIAYVVKKLAPKVYAKVWPVIKNKVTKLVEDVSKKYNDLYVVGPYGTRVFKLVSKKYGEVFRFDIELLTRYDGYYIYPHYHIKPNIDDHNKLVPGDGYIYWGKNKPPGL